MTTRPDTSDVDASEAETFLEDWTMVFEINGIEDVIRSTATYDQNTLLQIDGEIISVRALREGYYAEKRKRKRLTP